MMPTASYFNDQSMVRRVHREQVVALGGPRALLMQAAHPLAFAGFFAQTGSLEEPYERLRRTAAILDLITFGSRELADRTTRRVRALHRRVRGTIDAPVGRYAAGTAYAADDPELLLWIFASLVDSSLVVYERYVGSLSDDEREAYWQDQRLIGALFGLEPNQMPADVTTLRAYMQRMLDGDELHVTDEARELSIQIVMRPPVPLAARPLLELANFITVGLLPPGVRRQYGFSWDPLRGLALVGGAEYAKRVLVPLLPGRLRYGRSRAA